MLTNASIRCTVGQYGHKRIDPLYSMPRVTNASIHCTVCLESQTHRFTTQYASRVTNASIRCTVCQYGHKLTFKRVDPLHFPCHVIPRGRVLRAELHVHLHAEVSNAGALQTRNVGSMDSGADG